MAADSFHLLHFVENKGEIFKVTLALYTTDAVRNLPRYDSPSVSPRPLNFFMRGVSVVWPGSDFHLSLSFLPSLPLSLSLSLATLLLQSKQHSGR